MAESNDGTDVQHASMLMTRSNGFGVGILQLKLWGGNATILVFTVGCNRNGDL